MVARASHQADNARELSSRTRLSQISHHFLSDDQPSEQPAVTPDKTPGQNPQPLILPVLMNLQQDNCFPVYALSQALLTHKKSSAVLLVEGELSSSTCSTVFKPHGDNTQNELEQLLQQTIHQHSPDIYLIPVAGINSPYVELSRRLLIPTQATLIGIRAAYLQLKRLADLEEKPAIGVVIMNTEDPAWARRCFDKLAAAAQRFLGLTITSYGYLPDLSHPESLNPQSIHNKQGLSHEMTQIADMILFDLEQYQRKIDNHTDFTTEK